MASNNNQNGWLSGLGIGFGPPLSSVPEQQSSSTSDMNQFEQLDRSNAGSNTLKRNPKMELTKTDLLKLLTYFEGEIQARDITIAALKSERLKQVVNVGRYRPIVMTDPYTALLRDSIADNMAAAAEQQLQALEQLALQQRRAHQHMVIQELEEEKCKHEHDTAQGDDITYGLEMERTRLRQELEMERTARKKLEKELKRQVDLADEEKARQKQIVLLLIAEPELEKQVHIFEADKKSLKTVLAAKEARCQELEAEVQKWRTECEVLCRLRDPVDTTASMSSSVAKVVQPTATVSSVPVSGPTTGVAQSVTPGQSSRQSSSAVTSSSKVIFDNYPVSQTGATQSRTPAKPGFHTAYVQNPPQTPPKKSVVVGRGVPPPIPPNKPVIPNKQTPARRPDSSETEKKKQPSASVKEPVNPGTSSESGHSLLRVLKCYVRN
ncbi:hypothetical protein RI129_011841 [Pyrocoelia pectoralis]|uniref:Cortactin-binding protein-2 N-terminal domain-containing protein n=1 Tax=Pyrocoelia pectoralis TaxID=417401 RepID=A0AAN7V9K5_9COLE